jgi:hypothetical protein
MIAGKYLPVHHCTYVCVKAAASLSMLLLLDCFSLRLEMAGFYRFHVSSLTYMSLIIFLKGSYDFFLISFRFK